MALVSPILRSDRNRRGRWLPALLLAVLLAPLPAGAEGFSFLHLSDVHAPMAASRETIAQARDSGPIRLAPYGVTAPPPSFAIVTGDVTEFGGGAGAWETYRSYWEGARYPVYHVPGNHDNTWWLLRPAIRALHGGLPYAFDYGGCHFIALDSAGRQDPRPGFGVEELEWLRRHLEEVKPGTPLFLFFHHPLSGNEWASPRDYERLLEILRPHHVALMLVGHGHGFRHMRFGGYDAVMGGSTFDKNAKPMSGGNAGYNVVTVQDGVLRVAYRRAAEAEATVPLLEKPLAAPEPLPEVRFVSPEEGTRVSGEAVRVLLSFPDRDGVVGEVALDDGPAVALAPSDEKAGQQGDRLWKATLDLAEATPGVHVLRARFQVGDRHVYAGREILLERPGGPRARWRVNLGASVRGRVAASEGRLYIGTQDGWLVALDAAQGHEVWRFRTGGEVLGGPAVGNGSVYVASTDGTLFAVELGGTERWRYQAGAPLSAPPALMGDAVVIGSIDGAVHCVAQATGEPRWRVPTAGYAIETAACAVGDTILLSAWDTFVHALSASDGAPRWKARAAGTERTAPRYYSPADCSPVVAGGRIFAADRNYKLTILDAATGERVGVVDRCAAVSPAADGRGVYIRRPGLQHGLARLDLNGTEVWSCDIRLGALPAPPVEAGGSVIAASDRGLVSGVSPVDGRLLWQYQVSAGCYLPGGAAMADGVVYTAGLDGAVTAIQP
ncbi:MAG TPA: PQQ-binding-like beta-propeller repeat protein [Armatimonadota bacterium]|nr:PQQ-binding-like beta-propeller repeat protein [Armatimonadota bacterium]